jgi:heme/copper-type cytochrome/quinol oxidase subunit 4
MAKCKEKDYCICFKVLLTIIPDGFVAPTAYCASIRLAHILALATKKIVYTWV